MGHESKQGLWRRKRKMLWKGEENGVKGRTDLSK